MRSTHLSILFASLLLAAFSLGCGPAEDNNAPSSNTETQQQAFEVVAERDAYDGEHDYNLAATMQEANTAFAIDMYRKLRTLEKPEKNLVFSPFSISRAFSNYYKGAEESSVKEAFEKVFRFTEEMDNESWKMLTFWISDRSEYEDVPEEERSLFVSNDVYWIDDKNPDLRGNFDRVHMLDLNGEPEKSREVINDWIEEKSFGLLVDFLDEGKINQDTEAVTTNVVFFAGAWSGDMEDKPAIEFQAADGVQQADAFGQSYSEASAMVTEDMSVATIPYAHDYSMIVMMPHGDFDEFADNLDVAKYNEVISSQDRYQLTFSMPEFNAMTSPNIVDAIDGLREETGTANGSTLTGAFREEYIHKVNIAVTKEGTRAAAATVIIQYENNGSPEPGEPIEIIFDKPFVYSIIDRSGHILFLGEYTGTP